MPLPHIEEYDGTMTSAEWSRFDCKDQVNATWSVRGTRHLNGQVYADIVAKSLPSKEDAIKIIVAAVQSGVWTNLYIE